MLLSRYSSIATIPYLNLVSEREVLPSRNVPVEIVM
jgi:hypothetical protein